MIVSILLLIGVTLSCAVLLKVLKNRRRIEKLLKQLPNFRTVPSLPLLGSALLFQDTTPDGVLRTMVKFHREHGKNLILQELGNEFKLLTSDPRVIEQVIQARTIVKSRFYNFLRPWLGLSSVIISGQRWTTRRKIVNPAFHYKMLEDFLLIMVAQADVLVAKLIKHVGGSEFDVYEPLRYCTMDIISETAMGIQLQCQTNPNEQFVAATEEMIDLVHKRIFNPLLGNDFFYSFTEAGRREREILKVIHNYTDSVIQERKQRLLHASTSDENKCPRKMTFLDLLLETRTDGEPLPDEEVRGEMNTFMFAGHDTITSCVSFALLYLSRYPAVQQKLLDEIYSVCGADGDVRAASLTHTSLQQLKYMEMVIKETLRLSPSVPLIGRTSAGDMLIDGVPIPAGTEVMINIYVMQNDPDVFTDANRFLPERFDTECDTIPFSYLPFSVGVRSCIGQRFAMLEMKTILVKLLANYRVMPSEREAVIELKADLTLKPLRGAFIKVEER